MVDRVRALPPVALRVLLAAALVASLAAPRRAEAIAPVVGGAAAAAALAGELGISTEALMAATAAVVAAGTGLAIANTSQDTWRNLWTPGGVYDAWNRDYQDDTYTLPGTKTWDALDEDERVAWDSPMDYVQSQWVALQMQLGLVDNGDGGPEPAPEPDGDGDPDGHEDWQRRRNVIAALAMGASVPLSQAVCLLADNLAGGIKELLFGADDGTVHSGLGLLATQVDVVCGHELTFAVIDVSGSAVSNRVQLGVDPTSWVWHTRKSGVDYVSSYPVDDGTPVVTFVDKGNSKWRADVVSTSHPGYSSSWRYSDAGAWYVGGSFSCYVPPVYDREYLNAIYAGSYVFPSDGDDSPPMVTDGVWSGEGYSLGRLDYGEMDGTPSELAQATLNDGAFKEYVADFDRRQDERAASEGVRQAVRVPDESAFAGGHVDYAAYVADVPAAGVVTVPSDRPYAGTDPGSGDGPGPDDPDEPGPGEDDPYKAAVDRFVGQTFGQLFPFCLIGDLGRFLGILRGAVYPSGGGELSAQGGGALNGTDELVVPFSSFGVPGLDDLWLPLGPVRDLGLIVRPLNTSVLTCYLIIETFSFFLRRGGS